MLQLEMARRAVAKPATSDYGSLTIGLSAYARTELCFKVTRGCFFPSPRVDSAIVRMTPLPPEAIHIRDPALYERLVRAAFSRRRKTLRNALDGQAPPDVLEASLRAAGIDGQRRGETLSVSEFVRLHEEVDSRIAGAERKEREDA
jgi:16S rRNA (adenine1518-N6/adenine1519-N6)-dimethyltransferase